jgi:hypothetical protein
MPPLATLQRLTPEDHETLALARRDRIARERPAQIEERKATIAQLAPDPAAVKQAEAHAAEVKAAERAVQEARVNLRRAEDRVSDLWRQSHGRSHGQITREADTRARLRQLAHPAISWVARALLNAGYAAGAVVPSVAGIEITETIEQPDGEEARRPWFQPRVRRERQPVSTYGPQKTFMAALSSARERVENLAYEAIDDEAVVARLRQEIDTLLHMPSLPMALAHITLGLAELCRKLAASPLDLWQIVDEATA